MYGKGKSSLVVLMNTEKFRRQLRHESEQWWKDGLIDADLYEKLSQRYQFDRLEHEASHRFVTILMGLGAILLGLGAITFVAANWQVWSRAVRVALLLSCFVGVNAGGFYLWRRPTTQRLGHGLLLLGALLLGANMGLMSQMFNQSGELYELLLIWGLGVTAMAYSLRLQSLGVLALILFGMGYIGGWASWSTWHEFTSTQTIVQHTPLIMALVFVPLAYWCRSRPLFGLSAVALSIALVFNLRPLSVWSSDLSSSGWIAAIAFILPPALLWSYSDRIWQRSEARSPAPFELLSRSLAIVFLAVFFYFFAFQTWWNVSGRLPQSNLVWNWQPLIDAVCLSIVAGLGWMQLRSRLGQWKSQSHVINSGVVGLMLVVSSVLLIGHQQVGLVGAFAFNLLLFGLAIALIRDGLALGDRQTFWGGMVLLVLSIISRMLEYNTGLLLKSIVFALCGAGVIAAGLWFERNVKLTSVRSIPSPQEEPQ